jgi:hypothetical protein
MVSISRYQYIVWLVWLWPLVFIEYLTGFHEKLHRLTFNDFYLHNSLARTKHIPDPYYYVHEDLITLVAIPVRKYYR